LALSGRGFRFSAPNGGMAALIRDRVPNNGTGGRASRSAGSIGSSWVDHDLVFTIRRGGPIERTEDWRMWKAILGQARVRDVRVHDARHTAATLLIEQGVHIRVVQEILGHTRVTTTERYTHVATLQMKDASERMNQALWGPG
ncbi:MAG: tyrosine-type recombinase/integrase, partial [Streptosporangiaceae bacterium]